MKVYNSLAHILDEYPEGPDKQEFRNINNILTLPQIPSDLSLWIVGGAARKLIMKEPLDTSDFDIASDNPVQARLSIEPFLSGYRLNTPKAYTWHTPHGRTIQVLRRPMYSDFFDYVADFDFNVCRFGFNPAENSFTYNEKDLIAAKNKQLQWIGMPSMARLTKYIKLGYRPYDDRDTKLKMDMFSNFLLAMRGQANDYFVPLGREVNDTSY